MRIAAALLFALVVVACGGSGSETTTTAVEGPLTVAEVLSEAEPGRIVTMGGQVSELGELFCPCFRLSAGGESVMVWYDLSPPERALAPVDVTGIRNGDLIELTGWFSEDLDPGSGFPVVWAIDIDPLE